MTQNDRMLKFLNAGPNQQAEIDLILDGRIAEKPAATTVPLLIGMSAAAKLLGVSRSTLWRIVNRGRLARLEILPGCFRIRRADLDAFARGINDNGGPISLGGDK